MSKGQSSAWGRFEWGTGISLFPRLEIAEADKISSQQYLGGIVLHIVGMILSISKNKIFEVGDVDQKIEQAKIIMNENVFKDIDPEELAMKLNISLFLVPESVQGLYRLCAGQIFPRTEAT